MDPAHQSAGDSKWNNQSHGHSSVGLFGQIVKEEDENEESLGWMTVGMIQIGEVVGAGVLTLANAFATLGWVISIVLLIAFAALNVYIGVLTSESKQLMPKAFSLADLARLSFPKHPAVSIGVKSVLLTYCVCTMGSYLVGMAEALEMVFFDVTELCTPIWSLIAVGSMLLPCQLRTLADTRVFVWLNMLFILITVFSSLIYLLVNMSEHHSENPSIHTEAFPEDLRWTSFFSGVGKIAFAYCGAYFYLEMMAEMKTPADFPKSMAVAVPFQLVVYLSVGIIGYLYDGIEARDMIVKLINKEDAPALYRITNICLYLHLAIAYLIFAIVTCRNFHLILAPTSVDNYKIRGKLIWAAISSGICLFSYLFANAIPNFGAVISIQGAFLSPLLGWIFPTALLLAARRRCLMPMAKNWLERIAFGSIFIFFTVLMFVGAAGTVIDYIESLQESNDYPFQCSLK